MIGYKYDDKLLKNYLKRCTMKKTLKLLSLLFVVLFAVSACSKDDDPVDNDFFVDDYKGTISFKPTGSDMKGPLQGTVTVAKVGASNYSFLFSDEMEDINNIKMKKGDNTKLFIEDGALGVISIDADKLTIAYTDDDGTWTADCTRD